MIKRIILAILFTLIIFIVNLKSQNINKKLEYLYFLSLDNKDSLKYRLEFFENFPSTFLEFRNTYNKTESSIYYESSKHVALFSSLQIVDDTTFMNRLINLSIGGFFDADAVTQLQHLVRKKVYKNTSLLIYLLKKRSAAEIRGFAYFYFDGITVRYDKFPEYLEEIKKYDLFIYTLIKSSYKNVVADIALKYKR